MATREDEDMMATNLTDDGHDTAISLAMVRNKT
jgi:hypothetical protein